MENLDLTPIYEVADKSGLDGFAQYCDSLISTTLVTMPTQEDFKLCEKKRKETSEFIDKCKAELKRIEDELLEEYKVKAKRITTLLEPLEDANKQLQKRILIEKKKDFKRRMKEKYFDPYEFCTDNGEMVDFENIYSEDWYGKRESDVQSFINAKVKKFLNAPKETFITLTAFMRKGEVDDLEDWLTRAGIKYDLVEA